MDVDIWPLVRWFFQATENRSLPRDDEDKHSLFNSIRHLFGWLALRCSTVPGSKIRGLFLSTICPFEILIFGQCSTWWTTWNIAGCLHSTHLYSYRYPQLYSFMLDMRSPPGDRISRRIYCRQHLNYIHKMFGLKLLNRSYSWLWFNVIRMSTVVRLTSFFFVIT